MAIYSFYIFDRHTECIYSKSWLPPQHHHHHQQLPLSSSSASSSAAVTDHAASNMSPPIAAPPSSSSSSAAATAAAANAAANAAGSTSKSQLKSKSQSSASSAASDNAKLIFGTVFSLRNMVRKLGGDDDAFISYRTAHYKLHYYETASNLRLVMLTDVATHSMRNVLHQIYINLWVEYVVKNPLSPVEHKGGDGVRNELFEMGLDQFVRGLM